MSETPVTRRECDRNVDRMMHSLEKIDKKVDHQTGKIIKLSEQMVAHQAKHNGHSEATGEALARTGVDAARWKVWVAIAALGGSLLVSAFALARSLGAV